jgi:hypothetical protein
MEAPDHTRVKPITLEKELISELIDMFAVSCYERTK